MQTSEKKLKYTVRNEEIDFSSSNDEEKKIKRNLELTLSDSSAAVLYIPDIEKMAKEVKLINDGLVIMQDNKKAFSLEEALA